MKRTLTLFIVASFGAWLGYIASQHPNVWCDQQWAGISLTKGGYRSWSLRFCDGFYIENDGTQSPVHSTMKNIDGTNRLVWSKGYHKWPKFEHVDVRRLGTNYSIHF